MGRGDFALSGKIEDVGIPDYKFKILKFLVFDMSRCPTHSLSQCFHFCFYRFYTPGIMISNVSNMIYSDNDSSICHITFIAVYCLNCSILLVVIIVNNLV